MSSDLIRGRELAELVLKYVTEHPEKHNQQTWYGGDLVNPSVSDCGTTACLAGWAVLLNAENPNDTASAVLHEVRAKAVGAEVWGVAWHYPEVALKLLFPDFDLSRHGNFWEITESYTDTDDPVILTARAFAETGDEQEAIRKFAKVFGLEVPPAV